MDAHDAHDTLNDQVTAPFSGTRAASIGDDVPDVIGAYRIDRSVLPIRGGMGTVYRAFNVPTLGGHVAIKVMQDSEDLPEALALFEAEAMKANQARHPNVVQMIYAGHFVDAGRVRPYYVMEWLDDAVSVTDERLLRRLDLRARVVLFIEICRAVSSGHERGVIHADLKPSNIAILNWRESPTPKVLDFGLARAMRGWKPETLPVAGGTPRYMSPELAARKGQDPDARSDVYALGIILREMLLPAWEAGNHALVDRRLRNIMNRAIAPLDGATGRFAGPADLAGALHEWLHSPWSRAWFGFNAWAMRRPLLAAAAIGLVVSMIVGFAASELLDRAPALSRDDLFVERYTPSVSALRNVRVIRLSNKGLDEVFDRSGVPPEDRRKDFIKRQIWSAVLERLHGAGVRVVLSDLFFYGESSYDARLSAAIDALTQQGAAFVGALKSWESGPWLGTPSPAIYARPGVVAGPAKALKFEGGIAAPIAVEKGPGQFVPSATLLAAMHYKSPGQRLMLRFDQRRGRLMAWSTDRQNAWDWIGGSASEIAVAGLSSQDVEDRSAGIRAGERVVFNFCDPAGDDAFAEATVEVSDVLALPREQLQSRLQDTLVVLGDTTLQGEDTFAPWGRADVHGCYFQAAAIDQLITRRWPKPLSAEGHLAVVGVSGPIGLAFASIGVIVLVAIAGLNRRLSRVIVVVACSAIAAGLLVGVSAGVYRYASWMYPPQLSALVGLSGGLAALLLPRVRGSAHSS